MAEAMAVVAEAKQEVADLPSDVVVAAAVVSC